MSFQGRGGFTMRVSGLAEAINAQSAIIRELPLAKRSMLQEGTTFFYKDANKNVHVISGRTKASIHIERIDDKMGIISAGVGMPFEEKRGGTRTDVGTPHKTFSTAAGKTAVEFPRVIKQVFDSLLNRHKTNTTFFGPSF